MSSRDSVVSDIATNKCVTLDRDKVDQRPAVLSASDAIHRFRLALQNSKQRGVKVTAGHNKRQDGSKDSKVLSLRYEFCTIQPYTRQ